MRNLVKAHKWVDDHKKHVLACLSLAAIVTHYIMPDYDAHITAIIGFVCVECA